MAHLERHGDGWRVVWWTDGRGSKRAKSETFATKKRAEEELRARRLDRRAAKPLGNRLVVPPGEAWRRWLLHLKGRRTPAAKTYITFIAQVYRRRIAGQRLTTWERVGAIDWAGIAASDFRVLRAWVRWSARELSQDVPAKLLTMKGPGEIRRPRASLLTDQQVAALLDRAAMHGPGNRALGSLIAFYGHRGENLVRLPVSAVDRAAATLTLAVKGGDVVRHPLLPDTLAELAPLTEGRAPSDPLIISHQGKPWRSGAAFAYWWYHEVGDPLLALGVISRAQRGIQNLKRYAISRLLGLGLDVETIRSITGHRTPAVILRYARTNEERQRTAISALATSMAQNGSPPGGTHESHNSLMRS